MTRSELALMADGRPASIEKYDGANLSGPPDPSGHFGFDAARKASEGLKAWLEGDAFPLWWNVGVDRRHGGFHERLDERGTPLNEPRRARLHPRQMFAFGLADAFGGAGMTGIAVEHGLKFFLKHYFRADGFVRALVAYDGRTLSDDVVLYDQAFALLGLASAFDELHDFELRERARGLLELVQRRLFHPVGGYLESLANERALSSNSHMHLLEAALAWIALDAEPRWSRLAADIVELALSKFRAAGNGPIREFFVDDWRPADGLRGDIVEPGHQFEWGWLLLRWDALVSHPQAREAALALITWAEAHGVDPRRDVAINGILADGVVHDARARLWPQTERLKASLAAFETTLQPAYLDNATRAATALQRYLHTRVPGLWYDTLQSDDTFVDEPAPASSFYHLVGAICEFDARLRRIQSSVTGHSAHA